jgi:hypothetical protein
MLRSLFVCSLFAVLLAPALMAGECDFVSPYYYDATVDCDRTNTGEACALSAPVQIRVYPYFASYPLSCVTAEVDYGDGSPVVTGPPTSHNYAAAGHYTVRVNIRTAAYPVVNTKTLTVTVANGIITFQPALIQEGATGEVVVTRTNISGPATAAWTLRGANGASPDDISPTSGTVSFADGQATATIALTPKNDSAWTGDRNYTLQPGAVTGGYLAAGTTQISVRDDDFAHLSIAATAARVSESAGSVSFTVSRTGDVTSRVSVDYRIGSSFGSRVPQTFGRVLLEPGQTSRTVIAPIRPDTTWAADETIFASISSPSDGATIDGQAAQTLIVEDDPVPVVTAEPVTVFEDNDGTFKAIITLTATQVLPSASFGWSTVDGDAKAGTDYQAASGTVVFDRSRTATVEVWILPDRILERDETFTVRFSSGSGGYPPPAPVLVTIRNDDPGITPDRFTLERGKSMTVTIIAGRPYSDPLAIPLASSRPDIVSVPEFVTLPAGASTVQFTIEGLVADPTSVRISATLPPMRGGTMTISGKVYEPSHVTFSPGVVQTYSGQSVPVHVSVTPAPGRVLDLPLIVATPTIATAPATVRINADGTGTFAVNALLAGSTQVRLSTPDASGTPAWLEIRVSNAPDSPTVASLSPATGPSAGATQFVASGSRLTADCTLAFGGVAATNVRLDANGALTGTTPAHKAGTVDVVLSCGTSAYVLSNGFTYVQSSPTLASIAPTFGSTAGGTLVRANGTNFESGCWMFFGNVPASDVSVDSVQTLTAVAPPRSNAGTVETAVRCGNYSAALPNSYAYTTAAEPAASIMSVDPLGGAPGESVTLTGARFRRDDTIRFDDIPATILRSRADQQVIRIPDLPLGMSSITITDAAGRATTTGPIFRIVEPVPPQITSVSPASTPAGSDVTLTGRGFRPGYSFAIGEQAARTVSLAFDRAIVRVPAGLAPGSYPVYVLNASSKVAAVGPVVTITGAALRVNRASPACGTTDGGAAITIVGEGFESGATVRLNGIDATNVEYVSATELRVIVPANASGPATVVVRNPSGAEAVAGALFMYTSPFDPAGCSSNTKSRGVRH